MDTLRTNRGDTLGRINSNFTMEQYLGAALNATNMARNTSNEQNYVGISIWNLKSTPGINNNNEALFPYIISPAAWNILRENRRRSSNKVAVTSRRIAF